MDTSSSENTKLVDGRLGRNNYLAHQPMMLALLSGLAAVSFLAVGGLSSAYHAQREALGNRWFSRGVEDLKAGRFAGAVTEFRAALLYSRDDYSYQLDLAEALIGLNRTREASAYLENLWERQPENGLVNLELARIAVQRGGREQALRYYHNAIYATWPSDQEGKRRDARLELIDFLLRINARAQAEPEVIALEANIGDDPALQAKVGDLFVRTLDYERAFAAYRSSLQSDPHIAGALRGAGLAGFELGLYPQAHEYLRAAVDADPSDTESADRLRTTEMVLRMDPYQRQISMAQRNRIVAEDFAAAGQRLKACSNAADASPGSESSLSGNWAKMKPEITEGRLTRKPDSIESAMDLVFQIERQTNTKCGTPSGTDLALLLIGKMHEGN